MHSAASTGQIQITLLFALALYSLIAPKIKLLEAKKMTINGVTFYRYFNGDVLWVLNPRIVNVSKVLITLLPSSLIF